MDHIANLITSLRNAEMASHTSLSVPNTKMNVNILTVLEQNGYIAGFVAPEEGARTIVVNLIVSARHTFRRVSKSGRRIYTDAKHVPTILQGFGTVILSTPEGVMSGKDAKKKGIGGEVLCEVY